MQTDLSVIWAPELKCIYPLGCLNDETTINVDESQSIYWIQIVLPSLSLVSTRFRVFSIEEAVDVKTAETILCVKGKLFSLYLPWGQCSPSRLFPNQRADLD